MGYGSHIAVKKESIHPSLFTKKGLGKVMRALRDTLSEAPDGCATMTTGISAAS